MLFFFCGGLRLSFCSRPPHSSSSSLRQSIWNDVGRFLSVFIRPSVIFSPLSFLILCCCFIFPGWAGSELTNRDSVVLSLPRRDGNITQQRERQSQRSVLLKTMPASDCVILCDMDVQILCKCAERISQFQMEYLTSDTLCEAADQSFTNNKTSLKQDRIDSGGFSVHRALRLLKTLSALFVSRCDRTLWPSDHLLSWITQILSHLIPSSLKLLDDVTITSVSKWPLQRHVFPWRLTFPKIHGDLFWH